MSVQSPPAAASRRKDYELSRRRAYEAVLGSAWKKAESELRALSDDARFNVGDWIALATARYRLGQFELMGEAALKALQAEPQNIKAVHLFTMAMIRQNRWAEALPWFERFRTGPVRENYHFVSNHGTTLATLGRHAQAADVYLEALLLEPADPAIHMKLGLSFKAMKMYEEAAESFKTAVALNPRRFAAQVMVMHMSQFACAWQDYDALCQGVVDALRTMEPGDGALTGEGGVWALTAMDCPPDLFLKATAQVASKCAAGIEPFVHPTPAPRGDRKLRIGYVSSDFHSHATTLLFVQALEARNTDRFEVTLYSHGKDDGSAVQQRVRSACERFVDMSAMSEREMAHRIHADGIDVLIDLKGHTFGNRLKVFAYRPAPVQAAFLGFPGTCGASYIDYVIGDRWVTPLAHADRYSEKIAQMPHSYQPNDSQRQRPRPLSRAEVGLPEGVPVLCNFNQSFKQSPRTFDVWARIMQAVPDSVLWMLADNEQARRNLLREAQARGIDASRVIFAPRVGVERHLARLPAADLMLDNWPCNAHTTASELLWMGVPVVTMVGESFASRVAGSLLNAVGLPELACESEDDYVATAIDLLSRPERLQAVRDHLNQGCRDFPLFDGVRFAADLERLYERMFDRAAQGLPPEALPAEIGG